MNFNEFKWFLMNFNEFQCISMNLDTVYEPLGLCIRDVENINFKIF